MDILDDIFKTLVPLNVRLFAGSLVGNTTPVTEDDLTEDELQVIRGQGKAKYVTEPAIAELFRNANAKQFGTDDSAPPDKISPQVSYADYRGKPDGTGWLNSIIKSYTSPEFRIGTSLGSFGLKDEGDSYRAYDTYQWNGDFKTPIKSLGDVADVIKGENGTNPTMLLNALAELYAPKVKRPVNIRVLK